jgi:hypothetical protein
MQVLAMMAEYNANIDRLVPDTGSSDHSGGRFALTSNRYGIHV